MTDELPQEALPASQQMADWKVGVEYVGFYARAGAALIDTIVLMLPLSFVFALLFELAWGGANFGPREAMMMQQAKGNPEMAQELVLHFFAGGYFQRWLTENLIFSVASGIFVVVMWYFFSATPGKMLMGMKIVDAETGFPPNNGQNIIRYLGYFLSTIPFCLGLFWVAWDKRRQGWHDKLAGTVVVYKKTLPPELKAATLSKE